MKKITIVLAAMLIASLALSGCFIMSQEPVPSSVVPKVTEEATTDTSSAAKGTLTDSAIITNEAGGYFVPIPDAWIGRTSYELIEDETYIYHVTKDALEQSINPLILHIGAAYDVDPNNLYMSADVFLQMDDVKFYSVPVLDFPYSADSEDALEYTEFIADIPLILQNVWLLDESKWQQQINPQMNASMPFTAVDAIVNGVMLGSDKDTFIASLGGITPLITESYVMGATGETVEDYTYDFGMVSFTDGILTAANISSSLYGPRGFIMGNNINEIVESFCNSAEYSDSAYTIFYRANEGDSDIQTSVPPSCVSYDYGSETTLTLSCFENENLLSEVGIAYLRESYMFEPQYLCTFYFDEDGTMTSYVLYYGALAE
ncbi:MAG: hypothetical protein JXN65_03025 [Clostridia bacterium]|nr:hypothetical protein [Clostridia bacterium]